jgi:hypothetical protein
MDRCPYYEIHRKAIPSREIGPVQRPDSIVETPYCTHDNSPAPLEFATKVLGKMLRCNGDITKCQLPGGYVP